MTLIRDAHFIKSIHQNCENSRFQTVESLLTRQFLSGDTECSHENAYEIDGGNSVKFPASRNTGIRESDDAANLI